MKKNKLAMGTQNDIDFCFKSSNWKDLSEKKTLKQIELCEKSEMLQAAEILRQRLRVRNTTRVCEKQSVWKPGWLRGPGRKGGNDTGATARSQVTQGHRGIKSLGYTQECNGSHWRF